jgi:hypothetical protein
MTVSSIKSMSLLTPLLYGDDSQASTFSDAGAAQC